MRVGSKYIALSIAALVVTHLAASAALSVVTSHLYRHRMINVRHLDSYPDRKTELIAAFLRSHLGGDKPKVLVVGSSFAWGYSWPEKQIFSAHLQRLRPDLDVINASIIAHSAYQSVEVLCLAGSMGLKFQAILVEINLSNTKQWGSDRSTINRCQAKVTAPPLDGLAYFNFFATTPFGLSHLRIIRDEYNYEQPEKRFSFAKLPDDYFLTPQAFDLTIPDYEELFTSLAAAGGKLSENVIVLFSPIATEGLRRSQFNEQEIERQLKILHALCERQPKLRCLPIERDLPLEYFENLTHLNLAGHTFYGSYLAGVIAHPVTAAASGAKIVEPCQGQARSPNCLAQ